MGTQVTLDPRLSERVHVFASLAAAIEAGPEAIFRNAELLVLDGTDWGDDLSTLSGALVKTHRRFKAPFKPDDWAVDQRPEIDAAIKRIGVKANEICSQLYPSFKRGDMSKSLRPMITGPEPLHFDTYAEKVAYLTSFMNISEKPRTYCVSYALPRLASKFPDLMRQAFKECRGNVDDFSYALRERTVRGQPPLGTAAPRHRVDFAPGSIWFFDPKLLSHEVIYGEGSIAHAWPVPSEKVQIDVLRAALPKLETA